MSIFVQAGGHLVLQPRIPSLMASTAPENKPDGKKVVLNFSVCGYVCAHVLGCGYRLMTTLVFTVVLYW